MSALTSITRTLSTGLDAIKNNANIPIAAAAIATIFATCMSIYQEPASIGNYLQLGAVSTLACAALQFDDLSPQSTPVEVESDECLKALPTNPDRDVIFVVFPTIDPNKSFSLTRIEQLKNIQRLAEKYEIKWVRANHVSDITSAMKKVGKIISHLILAGHGTGDTIQLSETGFITKKLKPSDFPNLAPNAHILANACSAGEDDGIGEHISAIFPSSTVYGSKSISYSDVTWMYLDHENKPALMQFSLPAVLSKDPKRDRVLTRIFRNQTQTPFPFEKHKASLLKLANEERINLVSKGDLEDLKAFLGENP